MLEPNSRKASVQYCTGDVSDSVSLRLCDFFYGCSMFDTRPFLPGEILESRTAPKLFFFPRGSEAGLMGRASATTGMSCVVFLGPRMALFCFYLLAICVCFKDTALGPAVTFD